MGGRVGTRRQTGEPPDIHDAALNLLAFKARTASELARALGRRGYEAEQVRAEIARLAAAGLLDDATLSASYAMSRLATSPRAPRVVVQELRRRGVHEATAARSVAHAAEDVSELDLARRAAASRLRGGVPDDAEAAAALGRRLAGYLMRRGFGPRVVQTVLREHGLSTRPRLAARKTLRRG